MQAALRERTAAERRLNKEEILIAKASKEVQEATLPAFCGDDLYKAFMREKGMAQPCTCCTEATNARYCYRGRAAKALQAITVPADRKIVLDYAIRKLEADMVSHTALVHQHLVKLTHLKVMRMGTAKTYAEWEKITREDILRALDQAVDATLEEHDEE